MAAVMTRLGRLDRSVDGRVALITGAASGMGRATAYVFADEGARVALVDKDAATVQFRFKVCQPKCFLLTNKSGMVKCISIKF